MRVNITVDRDPLLERLARPVSLKALVESVPSHVSTLRIIPYVGLQAAKYSPAEAAYRKAEVSAVHPFFFLPTECISTMYQHNL